MHPATLLRRLRLAILATGLLVSRQPASAEPITGKHTFAIGEEDFLLDGRPLQIRCGEIHFARVPREYWRHRLKL